MLDGHPVRELDETDRLLFLLVHAAKHGVSRIKWLLDLYAVALRTDAATWRQVADRAASRGTSRPVYAVVRLPSGLGGVSIPREILEACRPPFHIRRLLTSLISLDRAVREIAPASRELYLLEIVLEEGVAARARMACGILKRLIRFR